MASLPYLQEQYHTTTTTTHPYGTKIKAERVGQSAVTSSLFRPIPDNLSPLFLYSTKMIKYFPYLRSFHTHKEPKYYSERHSWYNKSNQSYDSNKSCFDHATNQITPIKSNVFWLCNQSDHSNITIQPIKSNVFWSCNQSDHSNQIKRVLIIQPIKSFQNIQARCGCFRAHSWRNSTG